jgi:hypothetical protein
VATKIKINKYNNVKAQGFLESLHREAIQMKGEDMYYLPRKSKNPDQIYGEDDQAYFDDAIPLEIYIKSFDTMGGQGTLLSKFAGIEIRDQVLFTISIAAFRDAVKGMGYDFTRARQGDWIYFPLNNKCFEITYVDPYSMFYQLGNLYTQDLTCQLIEYKGQHMNTGIKEIDSLEENLSEDLIYNSLKWADGSPILLEDGVTYLMPEGFDIMTQSAADDGLQFELEADNGLLDFSEHDPFSEGKY